MSSDTTDHLCLDCGLSQVRPGEVVCVSCDADPQDEAACWTPKGQLPPRHPRSCRCGDCYSEQMDDHHMAGWE